MDVICSWVFQFLTEAYNFTILILFFLLSFTSLDKQSLNTLNWPVLRDSDLLHTIRYYDEQTSG